LTFSAAALLAEPGAETADHPAAEALRTLLANTPSPEADGPLPERDGWLVVVLSQQDALFLQPAAPDEDYAFLSAEFHRGDSGWEYVRSGGCEVQPWFEGLGPARWELAPGEQPSPDSETLRVVVFEQFCDSGDGPEGRVALAAVNYLDDSVIVILGERWPPGPQIGCGPQPPVEFSVGLTEPLGDRQLLDGWVYPPEPRTGS
jgi:hypothetical protein